MVKLSKGPSMATPDISVQDNPKRSRYEVLVDGDLAGYSAYRDVAGRRVFTHTTIDPDYEGHGVGSALARAALDDVRTRGLPIIARCPFIAGYIDRHPDYADLVEK
jgi:predicted GNAT family acetyltransferase